MLISLALSLLLGADRPPLLLELYSESSEEHAGALRLRCPISHTGTIRCSGKTIVVERFSVGGGCTVVSSDLDEITLRFVSPGVWRGTAVSTCGNWTTTYLLEPDAEGWKLTVSSAQTSPPATDWERECSSLQKDKPVVWTTQKAPVVEMNCARIRFF